MALSIYHLTICLLTFLSFDGGFTITRLIAVVTMIMIMVFTTVIIMSRIRMMITVIIMRRMSIQQSVSHGGSEWVGHPPSPFLSALRPNCHHHYRDDDDDDDDDEDDDDDDGNARINKVKA